MIGLTATDVASSRLRLDSSLSGLKRENVVCQTSSRSRAAVTASPGSPSGPAPPTSTVVLPPKHVKVRAASIIEILLEEVPEGVCSAASERPTPRAVRAPQQLAQRDAAAQAD